MSIHDDLYNHMMEEAYKKSAAFNQDNLWGAQQASLDYAKWQAINAQNMTAAQAQQLSQFAQQSLLNAGNPARKPTSFKIDDKPVIEDL